MAANILQQIISIGRENINIFSTNVPLLYTRKASENLRGYIMCSEDIEVEHWLKIC